MLGKVFWTDALAALTSADEHAVADRLYSLERKEFVRREQRSAVAGARQYVFVHALVRDGAYGQTPRHVRAESHRRAAEWIEHLPSDRAEDRAEMLAHHLVEAVDYGHAAGLDVTDLLPRAAGALRDAGHRAWALGAPQRAIALFERVCELLPELAEDPYLLLRKGRALNAVRGEGEPELARAAVALAGTDAAAAAEAEMALGEAICQRGDQAGAFVHFDAAASLAEDLPTSPQKGWTVAQRARFLSLAGRNSEAAELAERAIRMAEEL